MKHVVRPQSFYESGAPDRPERGRLFLFAYHFPPDSAAGALRWQKFAVHAAARGWGLDVLTLDPAEIDRPDFSRLRELPPSVRVFGVPHPEIASVWLERHLWGAYRRLSPARRSESVASGGAVQKSSLRRDELRFEPFSPRCWIRSYHGWQYYASHRAWGRRAARLAQHLFDPERHRIAISCGPPHGVHEGARRLASATGMPFVMDMRDPWSHLDRWDASVASPTTPWIARSHEREAVAWAALIVMNTDPARAAMQRLYPDAANRIIAVMNGYDEDDALPVAQRDRVFRLAYAGTVYLDRNPRTLFRAAARVVRELGLAPDQFAIEFMGPPAQIDGASIEDLARESDIESFVKVHPPGTRREATEFLARANMLLNLPQDSHMAIPSKVFEYMRFPAWLLALEEAGSATESILRDTGADIATSSDVDQIALILRTRYQQHCEGSVPEPLAIDGRLSRRAQAQILFNAIDAVLAGVRPATHSLVSPQCTAPDRAGSPPESGPM